MSSTTTSWLLNISRMAVRLHVHNNTVRYRVARLTKDFGLADPHQRLWLWLRLTTMDLAQGPEASNVGE